MKKILSVLLLCVAQLNTSAFILQDGVSQTLYKPSIKAGVLDKTFNSNGIVTLDTGNDNEDFRGVAVQPDGKIVAAGRTYNGSRFLFVVARYNRNGSLDTSFGTNGITTTSIGSDHDVIYAVALQTDGKIVVGGYSVAGAHRFVVARYTTSGVLDSTFGDGGYTAHTVGIGDADINAIAIQPDGKIVAAGKSITGSYTDFTVARYTANGILDTSFGDSNSGVVKTSVGTLNDVANAVLIQPDGKIVVAGSASDGLDDFGIVRYNSDGTLDTDFGDSGGKTQTAIYASNDLISGVALQADGKIVVCGYGYDGSKFNVIMARYTTSGILDTTYGTDGTTKTALGSGTDLARAIVLQADGKAVVGCVSSSKVAAARYTTGGLLDTSFGVGGSVITDASADSQYVYGTALQSDGKIVIAGMANDGSTDNFCIVRYANDVDPLIQSASLFVNGNGLVR